MTLSLSFRNAAHVNYGFADSQLVMRPCHCTVHLYVIYNHESRTRIIYCAEQNMGLCSYLCFSWVFKVAFGQWNSVDGYKCVILIYRKENYVFSLRRNHSHYCCHNHYHTHRTTKLLGVYWFHSVRPSVCPSRIPCPLSSTYSSGWIYFIFIHLIKQLQKMCRF